MLPSGNSCTTLASFGRIIFEGHQTQFKEWPLLNSQIGERYPVVLYLSDFKVSVMVKEYLNTMVYPL